MSRLNQQWLHRLGGPVDEQIPGDLADLAARLEAKLKALEPDAVDQRLRAGPRPEKSN